jgi:hypothetical protein
MKKCKLFFNPAMRIGVNLKAKVYHGSSLNSTDPITIHYSSVLLRVFFSGELLFLMIPSCLFLYFPLS